MGKRILIMIFVAGLMGAALKTYPQNSAQKLLSEYKDSLNLLAKKMQRGETDSVRFASQEIYHSLLNQILNDSTSFQASFDSVPNLSVKTSPDNQFRIYTWVVANYEGSLYRYYGFIQTQKPSMKSENLFALHDSTETISGLKGKRLKPETWYGIICYDVLLHYRKGKKFYTILGWKGKNQETTQKVIDVITFDRGQPMFGYPVFKTRNVYQSRVLFEYTSQAAMSLKYKEEKKILVFDHIGKSTVTGLIGPDGTYDAFKFVKGHWIFVEDVDVDNGFIPRHKEVPLYKDEDLNKKKEEK